MDSNDDTVPSNKNIEGVSTNPDECKDVEQRLTLFEVRSNLYGW